MTAILRMVYRGYRFVSWLGHQARRRFTPAGWTIIIALLAVVTTGVDTENTVAYQAFTPLFCLLLISVCSTPRFRGRFLVERRLPRFGTVGNPFSYGVSLKNLGTRAQTGLVLWDDVVDPQPSFAEWHAVQRASERRIRSFRLGQSRANPFKLAVLKEAAVPKLRPNESVETSVELTPLRRGLIQFSGVTVGRSDPLGLFRAFTRIRQPQKVLILPKRYALPQTALPGTMKYQEGGVVLAANVGRSDEFVALRDYRRGDPLRHIHWRSWAKTGKPIVKEFEDEFFVRHALVLDTFTDDPRSDAFEEAVSVAASFACAIQTQESLLDLLFVGEAAYCFTAGRGLAHADQMLEILASVRACGDKQFETLQRLVLNHVPAVSGCICVLLAWDDARRGFVGKLRALGVPVLVLVVVEPGQRRGAESMPTRETPGDFYVLEAGRIEEGLAKLKS